MTVDKNELRRLAEVATQGSWHVSATQASVWSDDCKVADTLHVNQADSYRNPDQHERISNASFIAAANPSTILALLDECKDKELQIDAARSTCLDVQQALNNMLIERDAALAELESFKRDAERYRWLRNDNGYFPEENLLRGGEEMDKAIDLAIQGKW